MMMMKQQQNPFSSTSASTSASASAPTSSYSIIVPRINWKNVSRIIEWIMTTAVPLLISKSWRRRWGQTVILLYTTIVMPTTATWRSNRNIKSWQLLYGQWFARSFRNIFIDDTISLWYYLLVSIKFIIVRFLVLVTNKSSCSSSRCSKESH